jgi:hypothetical protein
VGLDATSKGLSPLVGESKVSRESKNHKIRFQISAVINVPINRLAKPILAS